MLNQTLTVFDGETQNGHTLKATVDINSAYDSHGCLVKLEGQLMHYDYGTDPDDALRIAVRELDAIIGMLQGARDAAAAARAEWDTDEKRAAYDEASRDAQF